MIQQQKIAGFLGRSLALGNCAWVARQCLTGGSKHLKIDV